MRSLWFPKSAFFLFFVASIAFAPAQEIIKLPAPRMEGGMPLMQALKERRSGREFSSEKTPYRKIIQFVMGGVGSQSPRRASNGSLGAEHAGD